MIIRQKTELALKKITTKKLVNSQQKFYFLKN